MHFHLPKPLHRWRELIGEVGIIVVGVLIALAAEQVVEAIHWHEKVQAAERNIDFEINVQLNSAEETVALSACAQPFFDALEGAILRHDKRAIQNVYETGISSTAGPRATGSGSSMSYLTSHVRGDRQLGNQRCQRKWRTTSILPNWRSTVSSTAELKKCAMQQAMIRDYGEVMVGRLPAPPNELLISQELTAAERLRAEIYDAKAISEGILAAADGGIHPGWRPLHRVRSKHLRESFLREMGWCQKSVLSLRTGT